MQTLNIIIIIIIIRFVKARMSKDFRGAFIAITLLFSHQEEYPAWKKMSYVVLAWCKDLRKVFN